MQTVAAVRAVLTGVAVVFGVGMLAPSDSGVAYW
jgi:hypothetical protein